MKAITVVSAKITALQQLRLHGTSDIVSCSFSLFDKKKSLMLPHIKPIANTTYRPKQVHP